jgi:hypothetical protein
MPGIDGKRLHDKAYNAILPTESIRPLRDQLILEVLPLKLSETIVAEWKGCVRGRVAAIGPGIAPNLHYRGTKDGKPWRAIKQSKVFRPTEVAVGDIVQVGGMELGEYLFPHLQINGLDHIICTEKDVALIEERDD